MSDMDPRSDEAYQRAAEMADALRKSFRRQPVRDWLRLMRAWIRMWRASR